MPPGRGDGGEARKGDDAGSQLLIRDGLQAMPNASPDESSHPHTPALPDGHPLQGQLAALTQLRDQLSELAAHLEYVKLMLRLSQLQR
jgi:hypothetical protein